MMKKRVIISILLLAMIFVNTGAFANETESKASLYYEGFAYKKHDIRVYKSHLSGLYVCDRDLALFFEILDDNIVLSKTLESTYWYAMENPERVITVDNSVNLLWLNFHYYFGNGAKIDHIYFYSSDLTWPDSFVLQNVDLSPSERLVFRRVHDGSEPPLDSLLALDLNAAKYMSDYVNTDVEITGTSAKVFFPNMGERISFIELERLLGGENITIGRYNSSIPSVFFQYQGFIFWYFLVADESYDMFSEMTTFVMRTSNTEVYIPYA